MLVPSKNKENSILLQKIFFENKFVCLPGKNSDFCKKIEKKSEKKFFSKKFFFRGVCFCSFFCVFTFFFWR